MLAEPRFGFEDPNGLPGRASAEGRQVVKPSGVSDLRGRRGGFLFGEHFELSKGLIVLAQSGQRIPICAVDVVDKVHQVVIDHGPGVNTKVRGRVLDRDRIAALRAAQNLPHESEVGYLVLVVVVDHQLAHAVEEGDRAVRRDATPGSEGSF